MHRLDLVPDGSSIMVKLILDANISISPTYHYGRNMSIDECPNNMAFFWPDVVVKFLCNGSLYIDDGELIQIFNKGFCLDMFSQPNVSQDLYLSAVMCKNALAMSTFPS